MILYLSNLHNIINFLTKFLTVFTDFEGLKGSECSIFYENYAKGVTPISIINKSLWHVVIFLTKHTTCRIDFRQGSCQKNCFGSVYFGEIVVW